MRKLVRIQALAYMGRGVASDGTLQDKIWTLNGLAAAENLPWGLMNLLGRFFSDWQEFASFDALRFSLGYLIGPVVRSASQM